MTTAEQKTDTWIGLIPDGLGDACPDFFAPTAHDDGLRGVPVDAAVRHVVAHGEAAAGTVRKLYAESKGRNAIHASDSDENATREARFFFAETELLWG